MVAVMQATGGEAIKSRIVARDDIGVVVEVKEKSEAKAYSLDTCSMVMFYKDHFILVHRTRKATWLPVKLHSINVIQWLSETRYAMVAPRAALEADRF
jgi:hypothetical protein